MTSIAFQTSCYDKSYRHLLIDKTIYHYLSQFSDNIFQEKSVIVNNVNSSVGIASIQHAIGEFTDINFIFSDKNPDKILNSFNLSISDFGSSLYYSLQHFTGIYHTQCDYLFHVSEDCGIDNLDSTFINESIAMLESNEKYVMAMPRWCKDDAAIEKAAPETDKFFIQYGFTDQIYIIKVKKFKEDIYHYSHSASERYPAYGGECFEKRTDSFMRCNQYYGIVHKNYIYNNQYYDTIIKETA